MIWVDRIREEIEQRFAKEIAANESLLIRDEKTLSGRVHVGSLRGIVIHALVGQVLTEAGIANEFKFELNDFDPMDGLPKELEKDYAKHMGKPLHTVPSPEPGHENFPSVFGDELKETVAPMQLPIEWTSPRPLYQEGKFNETIRAALDHATEIRTIYEEISGGGKPDDWFPLQVICGQCGKIGTTQVTGWDPSAGEVTYTCKKDLVQWAEGCGNEGTMDPLDGRGKLPWKVEWAAKWKVYGVHIEGCGKDHSAAGGSRSIAARISEEIFDYPNPYDIPYEFFNFAGKKMSSSKGLGASAKEIGDMLPPTLLKLLMMRKQPQNVIEFDPQGKTIPNLFDEYDRLADHHFGRHSDPDEDYARTYKLTQLDTSKDPKDVWQMRFTTLSFVVQMPHLDLLKEAEELKTQSGVGVPADAREPAAHATIPLSHTEKAALEERAHYVKQWLETNAPDEYKFTILDAPPSNLALDDEQKSALAKLAEVLSDDALAWEGPAIHEAIHKVKEETGIAPKKLFQPLYQIFLGRNSGPQVGWFLSTMEREKVVELLKSVVA